MLHCTTDVRLATSSAHTIHWNPTNSRVIPITVISSGFLLMIYSFILLDLIYKLGDSLGQMLAISLECVQYLLLMLKFALLLSVHIILMMELDFQHMNVLQR